jgi:GNAT superfamily N-acetyltransferase
VQELQPYKIIFLTGTGGLLDEQGNVIDSINLSTEYDHLIAQPWIHGGMKVKIEQIKDLLDRLPLESSVSITRPADLAKELFTHKGSGTLVRKGEKVLRATAWNELDLPRLKGLIESSFGRTLVPDYFEKTKLLRAYVSENYRTAVILTDEAEGVYLDKFAVLDDAQGEGLGRAVWNVMRRKPRSCSGVRAMATRSTLLLRRIRRLLQAGPLEGVLVRRRWHRPDQDLCRPLRPARPEPAGLSEQPDAWNTVPTLRGQHVTLQPLQMEHVPACAALEGSGLDQLWYTQVPSPEQAEPMCRPRCRRRRRQGAAVRDPRCGRRIVGSTRFYDWMPACPSSASATPGTRRACSAPAPTPKPSCCCCSTPSKRWAASAWCWKPAGSTPPRAPPSPASAPSRMACCATTSGTPTARRATPSSSPSSMRNGRA